MQSIAHGYKKTALKERSSYSIYSQLTADKHLRRLRNKRQCDNSCIFQHRLYLSPHLRLTDIVKILMPAVCDTAYSAVYKMSRRKLKSDIYISGFFQLLYRIKKFVIFILRELSNIVSTVSGFKLSSSSIVLLFSTVSSTLRTQS